MVDGIPKLGRDPRDLKCLLSEPNTFSSGGRGVRHPLFPPIFPKRLEVRSPR